MGEGRVRREKAVRVCMWGGEGGRKKAVRQAKNR